MEYDPQPPFDSGHMSKASATTKAAATALMRKELVKPDAAEGHDGLLWDHAIDAARVKRALRPERGLPAARPSASATERTEIARVASAG